MLLLGVDEVEVGELFDVGDVDEECLRIDHVVVDVLEVVEQNLSPRIELVERLLALGHLDVSVVKVEHQQRLVGHGEPAQRLIDFADCRIARCPEGWGEVVRQILIEEQAGTLVGKDHRVVGHHNAWLLIHPFHQITGDTIQEYFHLFTARFNA
ncbi:MAG: hypothetical protein K6E52_02205 [Bacteroidaceae bacterium]|nr:hypothetical protein [Bacteroidaceae bacterium]